MILRRPISLLSIFAIANFLAPTLAFDCVFQASGIDYDLKSLGGLRTTSKETSTPPTTSVAKVSLDICGENGLPWEDDVSDEDQVRILDNVG